MIGSPEMLANAAAVVSILLVLFASPVLLGCYVIVQGSGLMTQAMWFGAILAFLIGSVAAGGVGLILLH